MTVEREIVAGTLASLQRSTGKTPKQLQSKLPPEWTITSFDVDIGLSRFMSVKTLHILSLCRHYRSLSRSRIRRIRRCVERQVGKAGSCCEGSERGD